MMSYNVLVLAVCSIHTAYANMFRCPASETLTVLQERHIARSLKDNHSQPPQTSWEIEKLAKGNS